MICGLLHVNLSLVCFGFWSHFTEFYEIGVEAVGELGISCGCLFIREVNWSEYITFSITVLLNVIPSKHRIIKLIMMTIDVI